MEVYGIKYIKSNTFYTMEVRVIKYIKSNIFNIR